MFLFRWKEEGLQIFLIIGFFRVGRMELRRIGFDRFSSSYREERERKKKKLVGRRRGPRKSA